MDHAAAVVVQFESQVLSPPPHAGHGSTGEFGVDLVGRTPSQQAPGVRREREANDPASANEGFELAPDGFDLGQLRHPGLTA